MNAAINRVLLCSCLLAAASGPATKVATAAPPSFERDVAPLLARHCLRCHDASARKGELDLSRSAGVARGGDSGPAVVPDKLEDSPLWRRIADDEMPPNKPLSAAEKSLLKAWIEAGAKWDVDSIDRFQYSSPERAGYDWWSLQPLGSPQPPTVDSSSGVRNDIDRFILAKLAAHELQPAPPAEARTLIRRLYFDLIGLPPTAQETAQWTAKLTTSEGGESSREAAYRQLVDHLLASPHYGERWARHWLDVVRFGESQGYERNRVRENAWRYRDWVIDSLNRDLPYDEFVRRQVAGDVLHPDDLDALIATGYHVCGTWDQVGHNEGSASMRVAARQDHLEDLVAALGQTFLGLTVQCARCHDHKFDPILQRDYYQIAAALGGVTQQEKERSGIRLHAAGDAHATWQAQVADARQSLRKQEQSLRQKHRAATAPAAPAGLLTLYPFDDSGDATPPTIKDVASGPASLDLKPGDKPRWTSMQAAKHLVGELKTAGEFTVEAWITPAVERQTGPARIITLSQDSGQRNFTVGQDGRRLDVRLRTTKTDANGLPSLAGPEVLQAGRKVHLVVTFNRAGRVRLYLDGKQAAEVDLGGDLSNWNDSYFLAFGDELTGDRRWQGEFHFAAFYGRALPPEEIATHFAAESRNVRGEESLAAILAKAPPLEREAYEKARSACQRLESSAPTPSFAGVAHVIIPQQPDRVHVLERGDFRKPLEIVSPAGIGALSRVGLSADFGLQPDAPEAERRKRLALWLTDVRNPLTARVFVNRVWHYHFGQGIVDTPSDFGFSGGRPSHPELLDWLARRFIQQGWHIKDLHRLIVTSATYRQSAKVRNEAGAARDANNRLLWRAAARRLEGEELRDAMLAVSGALQRRIGGPSYQDVTLIQGKNNNHEFTDPTGEFSDAVNRRTIYRLWARAGNNPLLEALDCPDPSVAIARRPQTITPVQSLSLLNGRFSEQCAARFAAQTRRTAGDEVEKQVAAIWREAYGREPSESERNTAADFVRQRGLSDLCLVVFNTNEFCFVE
ncbi:MAG: DUF1553 domain-containing protein [Pirellulales bacterium]